MDGRTAVTIGFFDGVHRGHQALLRRVADEAAERGLVPCAVTFDLHSLEVLGGRHPRPSLLTTDEKVECLRAAGCRRVEVLHFTPEFAAQSGQRFVGDYLVGRLDAAYIAVGYDFRFGRKRSCGSDDLARMAAALGVTVETIPRVDVHGIRVSSSLLRELVTDGRVAEVIPLMGRPYSLRGEVVEGRRLGRTIGFPTANLRLDPRKLLPAPGVYAVRAADGTPGMMNLGRRPTVEAAGALSLEVHLLDFAGDLYGRVLTVEVLERLRDERPFADLAALTAQLEHDRQAVGRLLAS